MSPDERLAAIEAKIDHLIYAVDGNGQPGILTRLAKLEERVDNRIVGGASGGIVAVIALGVGKLIGVA